jgi:hypothetical protein
VQAGFIMSLLSAVIAFSGLWAIGYGDTVRLGVWLSAHLPRMYVQLFVFVILAFGVVAYQLVAGLWVPCCSLL